MTKRFEIVQEVPIDNEILETLDEFSKELATFSSADEWINARNYVIQSETDKRVITHVGLNGLKVSIPVGKETLYDQFLARDLQRQKVNYICECITPRCFKMYNDNDMLSLVKLSDEDILKIAKTYLNAAKKFYPDQKDIDFSLGVYMTDVTSMQVKFEDEKTKEMKTCTLYKYGFHFVFVFLKVDVVRALYIAAMALALFHLNFPAPKFPENSFDERNDIGVLKPNGGGLRKLGSHKILDCPECGKKRKAERKKAKAAAKAATEQGESKPRTRRKICDFCKTTTGRIEGGRPYKVKWMLNSAGQVDEEKTRDMIQDPKFAFAWSSIRCTDPSDKLTPGFVLPENCPNAPKAAYYMEQMCLVEKPVEKKEVDVQLVSENAKFMERTEVKKKRTGKKKDDDILKKLYECSDNYETIQKKYRERIYIDPNSLIFQPIQQLVRTLHPMYKEIQVTHIFHNKSKTHFVILVDGIGSSYCLNKGANHTSANIYFYINKYNQLAQMCMSTKPTIRKTCECSAFASYAIDVPVWTYTQLKWKNEKSCIGDGSLQDMIEHNIYKEKIGDIFNENKKIIDEKIRAENAATNKTDSEKKIESLTLEYRRKKESLEIDDLCTILFNNGRALRASGKIQDEELPPKGTVERLLFESDADHAKKAIMMNVLKSHKSKPKPLKEEKKRATASPKKAKKPKSSSSEEDSSDSGEERPAKRMKIA